ncbi:MAG: hypothetical protein SGILL_008308, partial [Bacillariaceae sp.]
KMADDFALRLETEGINNMVGISECLVAPDRAVVNHGLGQVDNRDAISTDLTNVLSMKARRMVSWYRLSSEGDRAQRPGYGQFGFLRCEPIRTSPGGSTTLDYSVYPVTAKHNLRHVYHDRKEYDAIRSVLFLDEELTLDVEFRELNWIAQSSNESWIRDQSVETVRRPVWPYGIDIAVGPLTDMVTTGATSEFASFGAVRRSFRLEVGQKVGIAVIFTIKSKPTKFSVAGVGEREKNISEDKLQKLYGVPNEVNIYTGTITYVGEHHIEYDMNTFTGCSGAIVFLLDRNQPKSVQQCDYGKAVAVHGGSHPFIVARNLGFILPDPLPSVASVVDQSS